MIVTLQNTMSVTYKELSEATAQFDSSNVLGKGGYGVVYRACWKHTTVAVKRIVSRSAQPTSEDDKERLRQWLVELKAMALYRHDNVLSLYGYSLDGPEPLLIYQFMAGGSLEDRIICRNKWLPLSWSERQSIVVASARGLNFLHTITNQPLIHGDIKSANILLDQHLQPKIGDFGLSRSGHVELPANANPLIASHIKGTLAYLPPEFIRNKQLSTKLDVYSFGVVLFEAATGERAYSPHRKPETLAAFLFSERDKKANLADRRDGKIIDEGSDFFSVLLSVGFKCSAHEPASRPPMSTVIDMLQNIYS